MRAALLQTNYCSAVLRSSDGIDYGGAGAPPNDTHEFLSPSEG